MPRRCLVDESTAAPQPISVAIRRVAPCGTPAGRKRHQRLRESVCDPCDAAEREYRRTLRQRSKEGLGAVVVAPETLPSWAVNRSGQRVGRLTVLDESRPGDANDPSRRWLCRCDCGNEVWVAAKLLRRGAAGSRVTSGKKGGVRSCGCLARDVGREVMRRHGIRAPMKLGEGEAARRGLWNEYRHRARNRRHEFDLTYEDFARLTKTPCSYCGLAPFRRFIGKQTFNGSCTYSGLDRQDNTRGYVLDNVVPCCSTCNMAKRALTVEAFLGHVERIYKHQEALRVRRT